MQRGWLDAKVTRADFVRRAAAAGVAVASVGVLGACGGDDEVSATPDGPAEIESGSVVKLYAWQGYDDQYALDTFKEQHDVTVQPTYIAGDQEVFTKLGAQKGQGAWDVLTYNSGLAPQLWAQGLLDPLDPSSVPNSADIYAEFLGLAQIQTGENGTVIGLPFSWGYQGFIRTPKLPSLSSWEEIFDPALEGRIIGVNDPTTSIATMALVLGYSNYAELTREQLDEVMAGWERLRPSLRTIAPDYGVAKDLLVRGEIDGCVPGWQAMVVWASQDGTELAHDIPQEGVYGFLDLLCLIKGSKNAGTATAFIDHMLAPEVQATMAGNLSQGITNQKGVPQLSEELQNAYQYASLSENFAKSPIRPLPPGESEEFVTYADWAKAWEQFTAGS